MNLDKLGVLQQWILAVAGTILIGLGGIASLLLLYGGGSWETAARLEATRLSTVELSELVGTPNYQNTNQIAPHSILTSLAQTFHLPFVQPMQMLEGQLPKTSTSLPQSPNSQTTLFETLSSWETASRKINLGWIPGGSASTAIQLIKESPGVNVISPKWLSLKSAKGAVSSTIETSVINYAHQNHIKVWAMVDNQFNATLTHQVLSNEASRKALVSNLATLAKTNHLDGLNIDFENIHSSDEGDFTTFIRELHQKLQPFHVKLSVDVTKDIVFLQDNSAYFHAALAANSDYVILMAYDEHWGGDPQPGPVADVPWVTSGVNDLLDTGVPADKLILGIPLYARFWHVYKDGHVTSEAIADANIGSILSQHKAKVSFDAKLGLAYARYPKTDGYEEAWYETGRTLNQKLTLVNDDNLAGIALWSLNLSSPQTWQNVINSLRQSLS